MATFYFTYGMDSDKQAYKKGWTEVEADTRQEAIAGYLAYHPAADGLLPCCGVAYTREQMAKPYKYGSGGSMLEDGNGGVFCHDRITIKRETEARA